MILIGLLPLGPQIASEPISRITSVQIHYKRVGDGNSATATVFARSTKNRRVKQVIQLDTYPGGAGNSRPIILDHGQVAIFTRHELARFNIIVGLTVKDHQINVDQEYHEKLFASLPLHRREHSKPISDNVSIIRFTRDLVQLKFENRNERDGVYGTFKVKNGKWTCVYSKYMIFPNLY